VTNKSKKTLITIQSLCLFAIVILSFSHHIFIYGISYAAYVGLLFVITVLAIVSKRKISINFHSIGWLWMLAVTAMLYSYYVVSSKNGAAMADVLILLIGMLFCMFLTYREWDYVLCLRIIIFIGVVHGFGVVIQWIVPSIHRILVAFLPSAMESAALVAPTRGFTVNSGFAAMFICVGIIALWALIYSGNKFNIKHKLLMVLLVVGLLLTGKRAHPVFLAISMLVCYFLPLRGVKKMKRYWIAFVLFVSIILAFLVLKDSLVNIPFFASVVESIDGLLLGEDITSGRNRLIAWAWVRFAENPMFGIGWGDYRATVPGNVTFVTELDTHNIYIQLLCETGLIGFVCFIIPMLTFWFKAKYAFCRCARKESQVSGMWKEVNYFSFVFQTLFLLYGFTGNPLYDPNWVIIYMVCCGITLSYLSAEKDIVRR